MDIETMDFSSPTQECDLVMKGGITSGIVYPRVVLKLASEGKYRFRCVGGTSAGAIAATLIAAAEYGRETGGFNRFYELSQKLAEPGFLFKLFQPSPHLKPLMYTLLEIMGKISPNDALEEGTHLSSTKTDVQKEDAEQQEKDRSTKRKFRPLLVIFRLVNILRRRHPHVSKAGERRGALIGLGIAFILTAIASLIFYGVAALTAIKLSVWSAILLFAAFGLPLGLLGCMLGVLGFGAWDLFRKVTQDIPQNNFFGICTGRSSSTDASATDNTVLTDWLSSEINRIAMVDHPLTFGDLEEKKIGQSDSSDPGITLKMVTSDLSQNQPYTLPFEENHLFLFNKEEFKSLFPPSVVKHLRKYGGKQRIFKYGNKQCKFIIPLDNPFYFLPKPEQMPVVVAMRMSLSFPLLISAVPLYTIKQSVTTKQNDLTNNIYMLDTKYDFQKNWFSDGGISSNFPIHFFDAWLPTRPTFGINLASVSEDALIEQPGEAKQISPDNLTMTPNTGNSPDLRSLKPEQQDVYLPTMGEVPATAWVDIKDNLLTFLLQIFTTSQNYRDTMQSQLPGYRERIVQVRLTDAEGGLNLAMSPATINAVMQKGEVAGDMLCNKFKFDYHKWVRLRVLLGLLDEKMRDTYIKALKDDKYGARELINDAQMNKFAFEYESPETAQKAQEAVIGLRESAKVFWNREPSLNGENSPKPNPVLRTTPEF